MINSDLAQENIEEHNMKVYKSKGTDALIAILDIIFNDPDDSVRNIRNKLITLENGVILSQAEVDKIFGDWADSHANPRDPRHFIKSICALLKEEMFK